MRTFKIFNHTVSYYDGFTDYIDMMQDGNTYMTKFTNRYKETEFRTIITVEDFITFIEEIELFFQSEFVKTADELVKYYIKHDIYDMSRDLIVIQYSKCLDNHNRNMESISAYVKDLVAQIQQSVNEIKASWNNAVNEAITGHYFEVYSPYYSDILLNDYFNHKEEQRVEKKRQRLYAQNVNEATNEYLKQVVATCKDMQIEIQKIIYEDVIAMIRDMYNHCAIDLVVKGKMARYGEYVNNYKAKAILDNLDKITSQEILEEQLVNLLQMEALDSNIHAKILEHITEKDISEYMEIVKFLKLQNVIFNIYFNNNIKGDQGDKNVSNNCLYILKNMSNDLDINFLELALNSACNYSDDFLASIKVTKLYFECLKNIFGTDNKTINEKEQSMFIAAITAASKGTNLTYDGSIMHLDYNYLCEFWDKARKQRNSTIKRQEITQNVSNSFANWAKKHIKGIIIFIIIIAIIFFASKDSDNTKTNSSSTDDYINSIYNSGIKDFNQDTQVVEEKNNDTSYIVPAVIHYDDAPGYYNPAKANPYGN